MAEELSVLLTGWGLPSPVVNAFIDQDWTVVSLKLVTEEAVIKLIPKEGPRALFWHNFNLWKNSNGPNGDIVSEDDSDCGDNNSNTSNKRAKRRKLNTTQLQELLNEPDINDLHKYLKKSLPGLLVLGFYKANKVLDDYSRDHLCAQILFKELEDDFNKKFDRSNYQQMANSILKLFPTESLETWYDVVKKGNSSTVQGRLRYKYYSIRRGLIKSLLIPNAQHEENTASDSVNTDLGVDDEDASFMWLLSNCNPWDETVEKWKETYLRRMKHLRLSSHVHEYVDKFPALKEPLGWTLLALDGEKEQPSLEVSLRDCWVDYSKFIFTLIRQSQPDFLKGRKFSSLSSDQQFVYVLKELPSLFKVRTLPKSLKATKKDKCWRPSKLEVLDGVCIHVTESAEIQEKVDERKDILRKFKYSLQPLPVFLGPLSGIRQSFIVMDGLRWEVSDPFEAVAGCFKLSFGLGSQYPVEARHIWLFLQRTLYKITSKEDFSQDSGLRAFISSRLKDFELYSK